LKHKLEYINSELKNIRKYNLYRKMNDSKITGAYITINSKTLINMCSNDYLGITQPKILNKSLLFVSLFKKKAILFDLFSSNFER